LVKEFCGVETNKGLGEKRDYQGIRGGKGEK